MSMDTIKELREETGLSFAQIKKALDEVGGDKEKARAVLAQYSATQAEKSRPRTFSWCCFGVCSFNRYNRCAR